MVRLLRPFQWMALWTASTGLAGAAGPARAPQRLGFPIGIFSAGNPTEANFRTVKSLGFDYVHRYGLAARPAADVRAYLDMAQKCGLRVMLDISTPIKRFTEKKISRAAALARVRAMVARWKDHPALGFWYLYDEPGPALPPEALSEFHRAVKRITPEIPDAIALSWIRNWDHWLRCADIIMPDFYPVRTRRFPRNMLNQQAEFFSKVSRRCPRMVPIVQCFGFPHYPSAAEMRYIAYSPLAQGAKGLFFWSYWRSRYQAFSPKTRLQPDYLEKTVAPVLRDLRGLLAAIRPADRVLHPPNLTNPLYSSRQLIVGLWQTKPHTIVLVINNWPEPRELTVPLAPYLQDAELDPICSTRKIAGVRVRHGTLRVSARPWETFVWRTRE